MPLFPAPSAPLPIPWIITSDALAYNAASGVLVANTVYLLTFELNASTTILSVGYRMGATVTGTTDVGIYDVNGNLLGHSGAITNVANATAKNALTSALSLSPGLYSAALCTSNGTDTYFRVSNTAGESLSRERIAVNTGTAGVLPATTGGVTITANAPAIIAVVQGGLT